MTTCRKCGAHWTAKSVQHCGDGCHQTFASARPADNHRIGDHAAPEGSPDARRCRTPEELEAGGMWTITNTAGTAIWRGEFNQAGKQRRLDASNPRRSASQDSEQGKVGTQPPPEKSEPQNRAPAHQ